MSISVSIADVFDATYANRIQDALGNSGAKLTLDPTNPSSIVIFGNPTGSGLTSVPSQAIASATQTNQSVVDPISLSPAAQAHLEKEQIALQVITSSINASATHPAAEETNRSRASNNGASASSQNRPTQASDPHSSIPEDPTKVIQQTIQAAQAALQQLASPGGLQAAVASDPTVLSGLTSFLSADDAAAATAAFKDNTLTVQTPSQIAGFIDTVKTTYTGTSQGGTAGSIGFAGATVNGTQSRVMDFGVGQLILSWPTSDTAV